jgi:E3 ubiquitin-protein ligase Hakai
MKAVYIMKHTNIDGVTYDCSLSYKSEQRLNLKVPGHHKTTSSPRQQQKPHHHASPISSTTANNPQAHSHTQQQQQPHSQFPAPPVAGVTVYPSFHPANNNNSNPYSTTTPSSSTSNSASTNSPFVRNPPTTTTSTSSSSPQQAPPAVPQPFPSQRGMYPSTTTAHHRQMTEQQQQQQQQQHFAPPPPPPPPHHHISPHHQQQHHHGYESITPLAPSPYEPSFSPHHLTTTSPQLHMQALPPHFNMSLVSFQHHSIPAPPPPIPLSTPPQYEYGGNYPPIPYSPQQPHYSSPLSLYGPLSPQAVYERYSNVRPHMFHQAMSVDPVEYHRQQQRNPQVSRNHRSRQRQGVLRTVEDLPSSFSSDNNNHFHGGGGDEKEFG